MKPFDRASVSSAAVVVIAALVAALPILIVRSPPMADFSLHAGAIEILRHYGDSILAPTSVYALNLGHGGQLFHLLGAALAFVMPAESATKLLVALSLAGVVVGAARLARHLGTATWSCLLVMPAVGWTSSSGFLPNLLGFALFLNLLPFFDRAAEAPSVRAASIVAAALLVCHFVHDATLLVACVAVTVLGVARQHDRGRRNMTLRFAPLAVGLLALAIEARLEARAMTPFAARWSKIEWHGVGDKLTHLDDFLFGLSTGAASTALRNAAFASLTICTMRAVLRERAISTPFAVRLHDRRFVVLALALLALVLALPYSVNYGAYLYVRFLAPAYAILVVALAPRADADADALTARSRATRMVLQGASGIAFVAFVVAAAPSFRRADANARALDMLTAQIEPGASVCILQLFPTAPGRESLVGQAGRVLADHGGRVVHSLADYPNAPVVFRPEARWDSELSRLLLAPQSFAPSYDFTRFSWALVFVPDPKLGPTITALLAPEGEVVDHAGSWLLVHSTLPRVPIDSPDAPPPSDATTLQSRVPPRG